LISLKGKEGLFENSPFDERTRQIVTRTKTPLGILIDHDFDKLDHIFVPIIKSEDVVLIDYVQKIIFNNNSIISFLDTNGFIKNNFVMQSAIATLTQKFPNNIVVVTESNLDHTFFKEQDLTLISLESWKVSIDSDTTWVDELSSVLIMKS
jgi:hypothetical protein